MNSYFSKDFLQFFIDLSLNNNKQWFDNNRVRYEENVKKPFELFVQHMLGLLSKIDSSFENVLAKECIFRINRDIRFSKDKIPYKTYTSAVLAPNGKKSKSINGIYFECTPDHLRVYGGIYEIEKEEIQKLREYISKTTTQFKKLYSNPEFVQLFGEIKGVKNKILPKNMQPFAEKEPLIYNKQWYFYAEFSAEKILDKNLDKILLECYKTGKPIEDYFNHVLNRK
ncbi:MAG: DUF2461 domain-containing protein [Flavobacteriia bacterium]|nr:DUF2461 domain-containing protein [Flavobacteriia bacterium]